MTGSSTRVIEKANKRQGAAAVELRRLLQSLDPSLFDGHTEFMSFSSDQRLEWAAQVAVFVTMFCGLASVAAAVPSPN